MQYVTIKITKYNNSVEVTDVNTKKKMLYNKDIFIYYLLKHCDEMYVFNGFVYTKGSWIDIDDKTYDIELVDDLYCLNIWGNTFNAKDSKNQLSKIKMLDKAPELNSDNGVIWLSDDCILCDDTLEMATPDMRCDKLTVKGSGILRASFYEAPVCKINVRDLVIANPYVLGNLDRHQLVSIRVSTSITIVLPFLGYELIDSLYDSFVCMAGVEKIKVESVENNFGIFGDDIDTLYNYILGILTTKIVKYSEQKIVNDVLQFNAAVQLIYLVYNTTNDDRYITLLRDYGKKYLNSLSEYDNFWSNCNVGSLPSPATANMLCSWRDINVSILSNFI